MQTRRERIRQAAIDEIKEIAWKTANANGIETVTVNGIARQMGMTPPAFYSYFKNRDALIHALVIDAYHSFRGALIRARDSLSDSDGAGRIYHVYMAYRQWSLQNPSMFGLFAGRQVLGFQQKDTEILSEAEKGYELMINLFEDAWQQGIIKPTPLEGNLPKPYLEKIDRNRKHWKLTLPVEAYHQVMNFGLMVHGIISMELSGRLSDPSGDPDLFYQYQIIDLMRKLGIHYTPVS